MKIEETLLNRDKNLITILPGAELLQAVEILADNNIGALPVVSEDGALVGIVSERDIISCISKYSGDIGSVVVADIMTRDVITCHLEDNLSDVMGLMNVHAIRHMPVMEDGHATTMISSRDGMNALLDESVEHRRALAVAYELVR